MDSCVRKLYIYGTHSGFRLKQNISDIDFKIDAYMILGYGGYTLWDSFNCFRKQWR